MKRKLIVLSGILVLSLVAHSAKTFAISTCSTLTKQTCTNGATNSCTVNGFVYDCECINNRWYCTS
jgi:hypothetical protein